MRTNNNNNNNNNSRLNKWTSYNDRHGNNRFSNISGGGTNTTNNINNSKSQFIGNQAYSDDAFGTLFAGKVFADPATAAREIAFLREKHLLRFTEDESGLQHASCEVCGIRLTPLSIDQQWVCTQCGKRTPFDVESLLSNERLKAGNPLKLKVAGKTPPVLSQKRNEKGRESNTGERLPSSLSDRITKRY